MLSSCSPQELVAFHHHHHQCRIDPDQAPQPQSRLNSIEMILMPFSEKKTQLDGLTESEMTGVLRKFEMKSPTTGNPVSDPVEFNLMFATQIGPSGDHKG